MSNGANDVGRRVGGLGSNLAKLRLFLQLVDAIKVPAPTKDSKQLREWVLAILDPSSDLARTTQTGLDDKVLALLQVIVMSSAWDAVHKFLISDLGLSFGNSVKGLRDEQRIFGLRRGRIYDAVEDMVEFHGFENFAAESKEDQAEMVAAAITGGRRGRRRFAQKVGEERDWKGFFENFLAFIQKLIPIFLEIFMALAEVEAEEA